MGVESLVWAYGGSLGDYRTYRVKGILNTPESAQGLAMYKAIHQFGAPEWNSAYLDANDAFIAGKVSMVMSFFAFFPDLNDPKKNPYAAVTGFFANPAGPKVRVTSLGGQGLSILSASKKKEYCIKFLEWFVRPESQRKWARSGGYSCDKEVLNSKEFLSAKPYNAALTESMNMMRDFWVVPEYLELLEVSQKYWHKYLFTYEFTAEEANNAIANEWENIFEMAGYYKE
jgi:multiple sugar transport system substrate-binding protein